MSQLDDAPIIFMLCAMLAICGTMSFVRHAKRPKFRATVELRPISPSGITPAPLTNRHHAEGANTTQGERIQRASSRGISL